ncbi:hypothetical protein [Paratissierella segnis]|uniref:Glutamate decarboxylase n=1 Tax=Paratissierella segnis TaxID=2763679 RepID=A0A926EQG6_9FIRM|nr:hypothetical protein [Paratissierella segnis]MBC8586640.1 hypothetical protein [Paratissierella segnis]
MWTTVYVASGKEWAIEVENKLIAEGFLVKKELVELGDEEEIYEILVPELEASDVQVLLYELGII